MTNPASESRPYGESFALYVKAGWQGVIPVTRKYPPQTGYTGVEGLWPSYADMQTWADNDEGARNVALRMSQTIIGIDVDNYDGKHGWSTLLDCQDRWGSLPPTWRSTSRDDGVSGIRFYRIPSGLAWPGQLPGGSVELIRWDHRYAVVWPSLHPSTERIYRWITPDELVAIGTVPHVDELPELPQAWVEGLSRGAWQHEIKIGVLDLNELGGGGEWLLSLNRATAQPCRRVRVLAERLASSLASAGSRHDAMTAATLDLVRRGEQGHPGVIAALRHLGGEFVAQVTADGSRSSAVAWGEVTRAIDGAVRLIAGQPRTTSLGDPCIVPSDPPFDPSSHDAGLYGRAPDLDPGRDSEATTESRITNHESAPAAESIVSTDEIEIHPDVIARMRQLAVDREARRRLDEIDQPPVEPYMMQDAAAMMSSTREPCLYRVDQLWPMGARVLLAAQMKSGKTTLVANLLRSLLDGESFLGYDVTPTDGHVALIDTEMDERMLVRWLQDVGIAHLDRFSIATLRGQLRRFDLRDERILQHWISHLRALGTSVLVVDCLKPILDQLGLDENRETGKITTPLTRLMVEAQISELILVHHMGHNGERSRGDSALRGWPEVEWHLVRLADDPEKEAEMNAPRYFKAYGRDVDIPERRLIYDARSRRLSIGATTTRKADLVAAKEMEIETAVLAVIAAEAGIAKREVSARLRDQGMGRRVADVLATIERLIARQAIAVRFEGRNDSTHRLYLTS